MANKLSRRQVLAGLGTIGVASAGAGLGTTAFFSDTEELEGWYEAGRVDLLLDYRTTYKPWERYDLQMVPADQRPAIVAGTDGMTYEIAAAPALRNEAGEAISHEAWGTLNENFGGNDSVLCRLEDASNVQDLVEALNYTVVDDPTNGFYPGYINGPSGEERAMFIDLDDIKPYDEGETTFSFHLCGNPSFIYAELFNVASFEDYREGVDSPTEPEIQAGEIVDDPTFEGGELCDYLYVVVSTDPDCDNLSTPGAEGENPFGTADEAGEILYAGSMSGWLEQFGPEYDGRVRLPPVVKEDGSGVAGDPDVAAACFEPGVHCYVMNWYLPCKADDADRLGFTDLPLVNNPAASGTFDDELRARGYVDADTDATLDVNIAQTDACHFGLKFTAEQCRHNTGGDLQAQLECITGDGFGVTQLGDGAGSWFGRIRYGQSGGSGAGELYLGNDNSNRNEAQNAWPDPVSGSFTLAYDADTNEATLTVDDGEDVSMVSYTVNDPSATGDSSADELAITVKANAGQTVTVSNVAFNDDPAGCSIEAAPTAGDEKKYLKLTGVDVASDFTLTGDFSWDASVNSQQERPAIDIDID
ncbi:choice-of-anchor W domain-containing protein [Haloarchaeobius sp. DT45]|uniref:choice-of-anchor W domain-containing protein n=1 Tax=Haloarchaeobius sp. DT45 TaxID=3446116 RepID=UPI003F6CFC46